MSDIEKLQTFKIIFISILLEALPFLLVGVLISAILQAFVSDTLIGKLTPKHPVAGVLFGSLLGIVLPLCECGMIPIVRRLMRKGLPAYIGLTYIIAGPIINPVVFGATFAAFRTNRELAYSRFYLAFLVSVAIGLILFHFVRKSPLKDKVHVNAHHHHHEHSHAADKPRDRFVQKLAHTPAHAAEEFFDMGKYLFFGAFVTALLQTIISRQSFAVIADHDFGSHLFMMGFAYALSLCSTSDAFVAASFNTLFPPSALLAFLVFGPMIDLKSTLMMLAVFRRKFVLKFIAILFALVLLGSVLFGKLGWV
ncbi:permease [Cohnella yongneupensis]|uniref:Permease n=1 Tax=Cohnella yongneupensis TaxID=425006 RepID=A0ABW0QYU6_9BACL